ncbi:hypothetical protein Taro_010053 [Colocasia esculenta]|uniref:Uncharacterized protein n=1 Tax=Colocasia esculenta TaxID=4460 RepID=A0A843U8F0_COLES|nr:hypothetical protein [Colocasia esculenta]
MANRRANYLSTIRSWGRLCTVCMQIYGMLIKKERNRFAILPAHPNGNPSVLFAVLPNSRSPLRNGHARGNAGLQRRDEKASAIASFFERH